MNTKKVCLASFSHFVCDINAGALPAILPYFVAHYGLSYSAVSGLMLANSSIGSVIQPLFGLLADRKPRLWFMPLGIVIAGLGMAGLGFLTSYAWIFLAVGISGIGAALFHPSAMRFTNAVAGNKSGTATSLFSIGGNLGFLLAPLLAVAILEHFGFRGILFLAPLALALGVLVWFEIRGPSTPQSPLDVARQENGALSENNWSAFARLTGALIGRSVLMVCLRVFLPLYWIAHIANSPQEAAYVLTLFGLSGICGNILGGIAADRFGFRCVIRVSYAVLLGLLVVFPWISAPWLLCTVIVLQGFFLYASFSPVVVLGQRYLAKNSGFAAGITLGLSVSIGGLFAPLLGWLADTFGLVFAFHTMTGVALLSFVFTLFLVPTRSQTVA